MEFKIESIKERKEFKPFELKIGIKTQDELDMLMSFLANTEPQTFMFADELYQLLEDKSNEFYRPQN